MLCDFIIPLFSSTPGLKGSRPNIWTKRAVSNLML